MGGQGGMPPNRRMSGFFTKENWLCWDCSPYQKCSVDLKISNMPKMRWDPAGELITLPQTP